MSHCKTEASSRSVLVNNQLGLALIPIFLVILTMIAGLAAVWQWQRSEYHNRKAISVATQQEQSRNMNIDASLTEGFAEVTGTWLTDSTTFISPRMVDGKMGSLAVSVLRFTDPSGQIQHMAVQRGWAVQPSPNVPPPLQVLTESTVTLKGELVSALPRAFELKSVQPQQLGLWQNYDAVIHGQLLKVNLFPKILVLLPSSPDAESLQLWRIPAEQAIDLLKQKASSNQGYALQWFGLALVGLIGLAWMWRTRSKR